MKNCLEKSVRISWAFKEQAVSRLELEEHREMLSFLKTRNVKRLQILSHQHISRAKETALNFIKSNIEKLYFIP
jgi:DNA-binding GntR family transcriptional regulator